MNDHIHYRDVCSHGTVVAECRCPMGEKRVRTVPCPKFCPEYKGAGSLDRSIFSAFLAQPDGRSRELQVVALALILVALPACAVRFDAQLLNPLNKSGRVEQATSAPAPTPNPKPLPTPPPAATPSPTPVVVTTPAVLCTDGPDVVPCPTPEASR